LQQQSLTDPPTLTQAQHAQLAEDVAHALATLNPDPLGPPPSPQKSEDPFGFLNQDTPQQQMNFAQVQTHKGEPTAEKTRPHWPQPMPRPYKKAS